VPSTDYDLLIIGSGFGGSVCALRAADAGLRVAVLERGRRMTPAAFEEMAEGRQPLLRSRGRGGLIDWASTRGLASVAASAVGGGSHLYTAVTVPAPPEIFDRHWPEGFDYLKLVPYYDRVAEIIAPTRVPICLPRTSVLETAGRSLGRTVTRLPLAMDWPVDTARLAGAPETIGLRREAIDWIRGGTVARKRTLDTTYLARAEAAGATIKPLHEVHLITPARGGYQVHFRRWVGGDRFDGSLIAPKVVVAAGTLSTVRLLLECRERERTLPKISASLGERFFTNGDLGALLIGSESQIGRDSGPPVTAWLDDWEANRLYIMESGLLPRMPRLVLAAMRAIGRGDRRRRHKGAHPWAFGVMGFDEEPGRLVLDSAGRLCRVSALRHVSPFVETGISRLREVADALGAVLVILPKRLLAARPTTVHPLGGAALADSPVKGVVDPFGRVFGCDGLYVADGSLLPTPVGRAPSMTIAALAEYIVERLLQRC